MASTIFLRSLPIIRSSQKLKLLDIRLFPAKVASTSSKSICSKSILEEEPDWLPDQEVCFLNDDVLGLS